MRRFLLTVLLLTAVAISTSDVLPIVSIKQLEPELDSSDDQINDNTLADQIHNNDVSNDILYKVSVGSSRNIYTPLLIPQKSSVVFVRDNNSNDDGDNDSSTKENRYEDEGFRKKQWHNYPRQLDRLQKYLYRHHHFDTDRNPDPDDPDNFSKNIYEIATNDNHRPSNKNEHDILNAVIDATSPLLILKIRLAYLKNDLENSDINDYADTVPIELIPNSNEGKDQDILNPIISAVKVKREGLSSTKGSDFSNKAMEGKKMVNKRIFSLWSRLQSLSHKGHELHHRRHLHAFYGFPEDDGSGGGALTAETRASFIRPPGSPLRWG